MFREGHVASLLREERTGSWSKGVFEVQREWPFWGRSRRRTWEARVAAERWHGQDASREPKGLARLVAGARNALKATVSWVIAWKVLRGVRSTLRKDGIWARELRFGVRVAASYRGDWAFVVMRSWA